MVIVDTVYIALTLKRGGESREAGGRRCKIAGLIGRKWKIKKEETRAP